MDWLTFILGIVKAVAWPIVVLIVVYIVRKQLAGVFARLTELSFPGGSVRFSYELAKAEITASELKIEGKSESKHLGTVYSETPDEVEGSGELPFIPWEDLVSNLPPQASIIYSFIQVEIAIYRAAAELGIKGRFQGSLKIAQEMVAKEAISEAALKLFKSLQELYTFVVDGQIPSVNQAVSFVHYSSELVETIKSSIPPALKKSR